MSPLRSHREQRRQVAPAEQYQSRDSEYLIRSPKNIPNRQAGGIGTERVMDLAAACTWVRVTTLSSSRCTSGWTATGLGCAWDICNMDGSAAQADRALVCGIILQVDDGRLVDGCGILCDGTAASSAPRTTRY
jgi:hypothetical protein